MHAGSNALNVKIKPDFVLLRQNSICLLTILMYSSIVVVHEILKDYKDEQASISYDCCLHDRAVGSQKRAAIKT